MLPQRTHPEMRPTTSSGFVLRGYKVIDQPVTDGVAAAAPEPKRVKMTSEE